MPNVSYVRPELRKYLKAYRVVQDCVDGELTVKSRRTDYLPMPDGANDTPDNVARYEAYLTRAQFVNFTRRTLGGLVGAVFSKPPVIELPTATQPVQDNTTGLGVNLIQLSKAALGETLKKGRAGLMVDYPRTEGEAITVAQLASQNLRPTIELYEPETIINWRTRVDGNIEKISLVVLKEEYIAKDDGFEIKLKDQYRVLRLDDSGYYVQEVWRDKRVFQGPFEIKKANGERFDYIPFFFMGADANDPDVDPPPLYDIASLNLGHYRNSADYEEAVFLVGQPTPWISGLTEQWVKNVWKDKPFILGSRSAIALPKEASAGLLQADPNTLPADAMDRKERQMVALGAKLVQQQTVQRTASEAAQEESAERSTLSSSAENVSSALQNAFKACYEFLGIPPDTKTLLKLNTEFDLSNMSLAELAQVVQLWNQNAMTFEEMRVNLRRAGLATLKDAEAKAKIKEEMADQPDDSLADE